MTRLCPKCHRVAESTLVDTANGVEFRRCAACDQMFIARPPSPRGTVVRSGFVFLQSQASGEFDGRVMKEPSWFPAALLRGIP